MQLELKLRLLLYHLNSQKALNKDLCLNAYRIEFEFSRNILTPCCFWVMYRNTVILYYVSTNQHMVYLITCLIVVSLGPLK